VYDPLDDLMIERSYMEYALGKIVETLDDLDDMLRQSNKP